MLARFRPSPAMIVAGIALVIALGSGAYAASTLPKNSVGTKQLKNSAVTTKKIKNGAVTGSKVKLSSLGSVPNASHAGVADALSSNGGFKPLPTNVSGNWTDDPGDDSVSVGYYKDHDGFVHLRGAVSRSSGSDTIIATLPAGYRPARSPGDTSIGQFFPVQTLNAVGSVLIHSTDGQIELRSGNPPFVALDGIVFKAG